MVIVEARDKDLESLRSELGFTVPLLMEFPKCYWIWNYRSWLLQQAIERLHPEAARRIWEEELGLDTKMLSKDRRNFHAWGYRRNVVRHLESAALNGKSMAESEFEFTTKMIRVDLSNFSAWHNRSKLIPRLLDERQADEGARRKFFDDGALTPSSVPTTARLT
jgi:geranylgeranyl transferase type-2 subunit alpha